MSTAKAFAWQENGGLGRYLAENGPHLFVLYANSRSAMPARTIWRDESDQALDAEHTAAYVSMLRKLREMGGYHQVIVVSHNPDVIEQADARLRFRDGKVETACQDAA